MKKARLEAAPFFVRKPIDYGFFFIFMLSAFMVESILCVESIFMPVSVAAAGAGAGAMAGVVVSFAASSDFEHAVTASTAATKARRFMTFS